MILPFLKLGTLALRTISKPIATRLKEEAGLHPKFRHFIVSLAQSNHRFTTQVQRRIYGHATDVEIHPLNEERAVQAAADLLGEVFVFTVAGVAVVFEYQRSSKSESRKEDLRKQELQAMKERDEEVMREVESLRNKFMELEQQLSKPSGLSGLLKLTRQQQQQQHLHVTTTIPKEEEKEEEEAP